MAKLPSRRGRTRLRQPPPKARPGNERGNACACADPFRLREEKARRANTRRQGPVGGIKPELVAGAVDACRRCACKAAVCAAPKPGRTPDCRSAKQKNRHSRTPHQVLSTTPVYLPASPPEEPGCLLSSHPTTSNHPSARNGLLILPLHTDTVAAAAGKSKRIVGRKPNGQAGRRDSPGPRSEIRRWCRRRGGCGPPPRA